MGYCLDQVNRKWQITMERKLKREASLAEKKKEGQKTLRGDRYNVALADIEVTCTPTTDEDENLDFELELEMENEDNANSKK